MEVVNRQAVIGLTEHLNQIDSIDSIKFTYESEAENVMPFLDILIVRKPDGHVKLLVYRKETHTDQYLHFESHHPLQHKLSVIRILFERCQNIVTEKEDQLCEEEHVKKALSSCGFPELGFGTVQRQKKEHQNKKKNKNQARKWIHKYLYHM